MPGVGFDGLEGICDVTLSKNVKSWITMVSEDLVTSKTIKFYLICQRHSFRRYYFMNNVSEVAKHLFCSMYAIQLSNTMN